MFEWLTTKLTFRTIYVGFTLLVLLWLCSSTAHCQNAITDTIPIEQQRANTLFNGIPQCFPNDNSYLYSMTNNYVAKSTLFRVVLSCRYTDNVTQTFTVASGASSNPRRISPSSGSVEDRECNQTLLAKEPASGKWFQLESYKQTCGAEDPNVYMPNCIPSDSDCNCKSESRCPWYDPFCHLFDNSLQRNPFGMYLLTFFAGLAVWIGWAITISSPERKKNILIRKAAKMASEGELQQPLQSKAINQSPPDEVKLEASNNIQPYSGYYGGQQQPPPNGDIQTF